MIKKMIDRNRAEMLKNRLANSVRSLNEMYSEMVGKVYRVVFDKDYVSLILFTEVDYPMIIGLGVDFISENADDIGPELKSEMLNIEHLTELEYEQVPFVEFVDLVKERQSLLITKLIEQHG